jgi:hypothetical protein
MDRFPARIMTSWSAETILSAYRIITDGRSAQTSLRRSFERAASPVTNGFRQNDIPGRRLRIWARLPTHRPSRSHGRRTTRARARAAAARTPRTRAARRAADKCQIPENRAAVLPSQPYRSHEMSEFITSRLGPHSCVIGSLLHASASKPASNVYMDR